MRDDALSTRDELVSESKPVRHRITSHAAVDGRLCQVRCDCGEIVQRGRHESWESFAVRVLELVSMHARDWGANRRKAQRAALAKHKGATP